MNLYDLDDLGAAPPKNTGKLHVFEFERLARGMFCAKCGQRMTGADSYCSGKPTNISS